MDAYVARQPIFNTHKKIYAYELLFRDGTANFVPDIDGDVATSTLLANSFFTIGMDTILSGKKAFINFTQNLLEKKVPLLLPKESVVVEILEDVLPEEKVIQSCQELSDKGYLLALDDFEYDSSLLPLIVMADIIKFDFRLTPPKKIAAYLKHLPKKGLRLLAEKVETHAEFDTALEMGFQLFQGYFFCKPEIIQGRQIPGSQFNLLQIVAQVNKKELSIEELEVLISRDVSISYKLLRYINSAFFAKANKIASIKQALVYMGEKEIRRFISLFAISKIAKEKPNELVRASCIRGKFCELLADQINGQADPSELFTLGMFSLIDAIVDQPMDEIMQLLPLSQGIQDALLEGKGHLVEYLHLAESYERGDWKGISSAAQGLRMDEKKLPPLYLDACKWSDTISHLS